MYFLFFIAHVSLTPDLSSWPIHCEHYSHLIIIIITLAD